MLEHFGANVNTECLAMALCTLCVPPYLSPKVYEVQRMLLPRGIRRLRDTHKTRTDSVNAAKELHKAKERNPLERLYSQKPAAVHPPS